METVSYFLSSGNSKLLLGAFFLILETKIENWWNRFEQKIILLLIETIFDFFSQKKPLFHIVKTYFLTSASFRVVETDFLACTNHNFFPSSGNVFLNESFILAVGEGFSPSWKPSE